MSILSDFEDRMARAVEGVFAGVFKAPVQPAELARACAKEMDRRKKLGVGKVYAPTLFSVLLSPADGASLGGFADTLAGELSTYLMGHARERDYVLATRPVVRFLVDDQLKLGRYEVIGELLSPEEIEAELGHGTDDDGYFDPEKPEPHSAVPTPVSPVAHSTVFDVEAEESSPAETTILSAPVTSTITIPGVAHDVVLRGERMVMGRLKSCDLCLGDANASRKHAVLEREGTGWVMVDLGSTNGTLVNGERVSRVRLRDGDVITIGISELIYHEPRG
ncbi:MAG: hypothetical protein CVT67_02705 [Actinobacteria bacterium HGW-Actinobacteria-7]|nr:MAG: hypothetical protein CVT67_02705 [Actinobacteria bacterium HGW-Actinobacteria-7]